MNVVNRLSRVPQAFAIGVTCIVLVALCTRLIRLSYPTSFFFDEVYHGFTATTYLHNDPKGYEYWQSPPAGVAYEWTHPPLAKLLMAGGMMVLGENSVGWRISSALFGTGVVAATGLLAHELFRRKSITLLSMGLVSMDGLLLTMSRIAMNDMHFLFFALLGIIFYVRFRRVQFDDAAYGLQARWLVGSAIALGLALASKWTALYVGAALAVDFWLAMIGRRTFPLRTIALATLIYATMVPSVYLLSYTQFFLQNHTLTQFKETQQQMWWYHTGLKATHGYQSRPWQWVLNLRPVWMHVDYAKNDQGVLSHIYNVGNSIGFWIGASSMVTILLLVARAVTKRLLAWMNHRRAKWTVSWEIWFVLLLYLFLWMPWQFSPRIMFFYHYAPAIPLLSIASAWIGVTFLLPGKITRIALGVAVLLVAFAFVILYPINTGLPMPTAYFDRVFSVFPMWR